MPVDNKKYAFPTAFEVEEVEYGLTKLEYAAIHILAGMVTENMNGRVEKAISIAKTLFEQLEKEK